MSKSGKKYIQRSFRTDPGVWDEVKELAKELGMSSAAEFVRLAVEHEIQQQRIKLSWRKAPAKK